MLHLRLYFMIGDINEEVRDNDQREKIRHQMAEEISSKIFEKIL